MAMNVSDFVWRRVNEWGIKRVFGYPGDGVGGLDVALEKAKATLQYIQVRHEEMAAFMASAHAKFTGEVGLCYATSGPGAIHLLNGLYDAKMDHVPVVAIVGQQARTAIGASYQQEVDLQSLFKDVAADYVATACMPIVPLAPGRLIRTTDVPSADASAGSIMRTAVSTGPPGVAGTITCTGRAGKCSCATAPIVDAASTMPARAHSCLIRPS